MEDIYRAVKRRGKYPPLSPTLRYIPHNLNNYKKVSLFLTIYPINLAVRGAMLTDGKRFLTIK